MQPRHAKIDQGIITDYLKAVINYLFNVLLGMIFVKLLAFHAGVFDHTLSCTFHDKVFKNFNAIRDETKYNK